MIAAIKRWLCWHLGIVSPSQFYVNPGAALERIHPKLREPWVRNYERARLELEREMDAIVAKYERQEDE